MENNNQSFPRPSSDSLIEYLLKHCSEDCRHCPVFDLCWSFVPSP